MNDGDALLRAILLNPAEDTPRLIYADYLDEYGGDATRAEFIRLQIKLAEYARVELDYDKRRETHPHMLPYGGNCECSRILPKDKPCLFCRTRGRAEKLLEQHHFTWAPGPLVEAGWQANSTWVPTFEYQFRRGFVEWMGGPLADFLAHAGAIFAKHPITSVQTDRFPDGDSGREGWNWYRAEGDFFNGNSASLPAAVYERLIGGRMREFLNPWEMVYPTDKDAYADLLQALVTVGRRAAGILFFPNGTTAPKC